MSVHASQLRLPTAEVEADYGERQKGSASKLLAADAVQPHLQAHKIHYRVRQDQHHNHQAEDSNAGIFRCIVGVILRLWIR